MTDAEVLSKVCPDAEFTEENGAVAPNKSSYSGWRESKVKRATP